MSYSKPKAVHELHNFKHDAFEMNDEAFAERHGVGFLLHAGDIGVSAVDMSENDTVEMDPEQAQRRRGHFLVFPLGRYSDLHTIRIGSAAHNDVTLEHASVAPAHAVLVCESRSSLSCWRTAADHETAFNGSPAPLYDSPAEKQLLSSGASLQVGGVSLVFLTSAAFRALVRQLLTQ